MFRKTITAGIATLALGGAALLTAGPALADTPVNVSATVNSTISVSGITGSIALAGNPGTTATNANAEQYNVQTNNAAGYSVTVTPQANTLQGPGNPISNTNLAVNTGHFTVPATPLTVHSKSSPSAMNGDNLTDSWSLDIPQGQAAGSYTGSFSYIVVAN